ncbi:hypothetical protein DXG03_006373 [Asterophora parasitica]|uniref:Uncharacterized protein n=1 Tax=Asterophora parasitica TaxID=117018 RepID=A0A9P7G562_9AGAR|nr:hypothetical protein DXG03_006373 [Asterophora parasitica]
MPQFQLEVSIALAIAALGSVTTFYLNRTKAGKIKLPTHSGEDFEEETTRRHDSFDLTAPEDFIDGYPIEADAFWEKSKRRKAFMSFLVTAILVIDLNLLGWSIAHDEQVDIVVNSISGAVSLYLVTIAVLSVNAVESHSEYICHLWALTTLAFFCLGSTAILPYSPSVSQYPPGLHHLWLAKTALYTVESALYLTTSHGPRLYFPPDRIYSEKTIQATTNHDEENVAGIKAASIYETLLFAYTTKVVLLGNTASSLETGDLPIVPVDMRATFNYSKMKRGMQEVRLRIGKWSPKPGSGWEMGWRLLRLNLSSMLLLLALASTSAVMAYVPALFLQQFVKYLERDPERKDTSWGWFYVVGLFASNVIVYSIRFRVQLNSILYAKTLVRKDIASSAPPPASTTDKNGDNAPKTEGESDSENKDDKGDFSSKAQIMTLMTTDVDRVSQVAWHIHALIGTR